MPIAVQLVALPWREETLLRAMAAVEKVAGFDTSQGARLQPEPRRSPQLTNWIWGEFSHVL